MEVWRKCVGIEPTGPPEADPQDLKSRADTSPHALPPGYYTRQVVASIPADWGVSVPVGSWVRLTWPFRQKDQRYFLRVHTSVDSGNYLFVSARFLAAHVHAGALLCIAIAGFHLMKLFGLPRRLSRTTQSLLAGAGWPNSITLRFGSNMQGRSARSRKKNVLMSKFDISTPILSRVILTWARTAFDGLESVWQKGPSRRQARRVTDYHDSAIRANYPRAGGFRPLDHSGAVPGSMPLKLPPRLEPHNN